MRKLLIFLLVITMSFALCACDLVDKFLGNDDSSSTQDKNENTDVKNESNDSTKTEYKYLDFNGTEKNLFNTYIGTLIPFIPCDEYYVEGYYDIADYEYGMNFYTIGNTEAEFEEYLTKFDGYTLDETYKDDNNNTWYCYVKDDIVIDISYYSEDGECYVDVFVYSSLSKDIEDETPDQDNGTKADEWRENYDCITVKEALDICDKTGSTESERYYLIATVVSVDDTQYGQMTVKDSTGEIMVYGSYGADGKDRYGAITGPIPKAGDVVLFYGTFKTYKSTREMYSGWIIDFYTPTDNNTDSGVGGGSNDTETGTQVDEWLKNYDCITVKEALDICDKTGSTESERYYLIATVVSVDDTQYGQMTVKDSTGEIMVYGSYGADGKDRYGAITGPVPKAGDVVLFYGTFKTYKTTREMYSGWIIDFYSAGGSEGDNPDSGSGSGAGSNPNVPTYTYIDFSNEDKKFITDSIGFVIPFIPCDEYEVEEYSYEETGYAELGINFYTFGNTEAEFNNYLKLFDKYTFDYEEEDSYGDTWYYYSYEDVMIDVGFYYNEGEYIVEVYAYFIFEDNVNPDEGGGSGETGGTGSSGGTVSDTSVITNAGAGLPEDSDGVFDVDFTKAENVKDATDQGYYIDGCPTTGSPAVLVIPVEFSDSLASSKGYTTDALVNAFAKDGKNDYYSVHDYYYISSYGKLNLDITVLDFWFKPKNNSTYYYNATFDYEGEETSIGDQLVMDEALAYLEGIMDLSKFDSDNNGIIDAVVLVNTLDIGEEDFYWAYRYWNIYTDDEGYYYEYDKVSANDYIWMSYQFLNESTDSDGNTIYNSKTMNTYTFIHEFAHILGADDYYDTEYVADPMAGCDVMDSMLGDHNAYTKINLGWITSSRLVVTDGSITLSLEDFSKNGDTIIIANNWDEKLGAYQEYYVIVYYKNTGLNGGDAGYFYDDGIVVYHVNASLFKEEYDGEVYYDVYNTNTDSSSEYGTEDNLIELVKSSNGNFVFVVGDTLPGVTDDLGEKLSYTFVVDAITEDSATITVTAIN